MKRRFLVIAAASLSFTGITLANISQEKVIVAPKSWELIDRKMAGPETCALNFNRDMVIGKSTPIALRAQLNGFWLNEISIVDATGTVIRSTVRQSIPRGRIVLLSDLFGQEINFTSVGLHMTCLPQQREKTSIEVLAWR
jgi:hypothetical protein